MFTSSIDYQKRVTEVIKEDGELLLAVSFWGRGAETLIHPRANGPVKLICNLKSGATNPDTIEALRNRNGVTVKQHDRLHAKVVVGSRTAVVGSANFSSNGLNLEGDELQGWEEAGLLTQDATHRDQIKQWFGAMWRDSRSIDDQDIKEARAIWAKRRGTRIQKTSISGRSFALGDFTSRDVLDRPVFLVIYTDYLSDDAEAAGRKREEEITGQPVARSSKPMYENWPELPKDAELIDIYRGPRGALKCTGVFKRTEEFEFKYKNGKKGHLAICRKVHHVMDRPFQSKDASKLVSTLQPHIEAIWNSQSAKGSKDGMGKCIKLADVIEVIELCG